MQIRGVVRDAMDRTLNCYNKGPLLDMAVALGQKHNSKARKADLVQLLQHPVTNWIMSSESNIQTLCATLAEGFGTAAEFAARIIANYDLQGKGE